MLAFALAFAIYAIVLLIVIPARKDTYKPLNWSMYLFSAILFVAITSGCVLGDKSSEYNAKSLTYGAVCVALSFALSYIKFFSLPQGGSVTFASMLPLCLYSYMFGTKKGVFAGLIYGVLQAVQDPWIIHPAQFLLDYPVAFAGIGVAG
ncbi:MAG: energy-coupled thiamine transporter ThiT, partial [Clostridia bacterium]|nr:energy-coupled thiamine transporter ThiT [Clostridia bacterium]